MTTPHPDQTRALVERINAAATQRAMTLLHENLTREGVTVDEDLTVVLEGGVAAGVAGMWAELSEQGMLRAPASVSRRG